MKAYKGFNNDMSCRGFQYEEGKSYETNEEIKICKSGFHSCEYPLDCFYYYVPAESVFHEVEVDGDISRSIDSDTKIASQKIKIGARLDIAGIVKASIEFIKGKTDKANSTTGDYSANSVTGERSANSSTGERSANSSTGYGSANSTTGDRSANSSTSDHSANSSTGYGSANSSTGYGSANSSTGYSSVNSATGDRSANSSTGYRSANSSTGDHSANSSTGYGSANSSTGDYSANEGSDGTISVGWGRDNKCRGKKGAYIVLAEYGEWDGSKYPIINAKMGYIDGETLKEDVWYVLKNGEFEEYLENTETIIGGDEDVKE